MRERGREREDDLPGARFEVSDLKRALDRFRSDDMTDSAASLTYYALMSLFPAMLFGVAILGLVGEQGLVTDATDYLRDAGAPTDTVDAVEGFLESAVEANSTAVGALVLGLLTTLYGASGAFGAMGRALNIVWRVDEGRSFLRRKGMDLAWTLINLILAVVTFILIFLGGDFARDVLGAIGLGDTAADLWLYLRGPAALATALLIYALVYYAAPNVEVPRFQWITPGAIVGVVAWLLISAAFFFYVANFGSYNKTYGAFAGVVILLVWLWLTNVAILFGAELNAAIKVRRTPEFPRTYDGPPLPEKEAAEV